MFERFGGGIETVIAKLKEVDQKNYKTTEDFIEKVNTLLSQYQDLVYGSYNTVERKRARQTFLENQGLDWICKTLTSEYYQFVESHVPSNVEEAYVLICCLGKFKASDQLLHPHVATKPKEKLKAIMPPPDDLSENMKKLAQGMTTLTTYMTSGEQAKSSLYCHNCKKQGHLIGTCKGPCNRCRANRHGYVHCPNNCQNKPKTPAAEPKQNQKQAPKPKKEMEPSAAKDESYLVESMAAVRTNVAQKHRLSHIAHPYNTPEKQKGAEAAKPQQPTPDAHLPNQAPPVAPETEQTNNTQSAQQTDHEAQQSEPFGIPMNEEDGTYPVEPTIEVAKGTSSKTTLKKPKVKLPVLPQVKPPKLNVLKILADTQIPISLYNLAEIAPSVRAQMVHYLGATRVRDPEEHFAVMEEKPQEAQEVVDVISEGAPHIDGEVEGHPTPIILDGGSTSNIILLQPSFQTCLLMYLTIHRGRSRNRPLTYLTLWINPMAISNGGYFILIRSAANSTC
ncbi:hypothetical protein DSO57_1020385 [Entomophthora muscae]|uniref:Uncharacterized protein n=1 Tax=Entomophthora muscae TaxID=34485 RepID=A0ACC2UP45_9FUNG|nr:hypothetical protein DSO57_1020385 [Entomophthora muscae]